MILVSSKLVDRCIEELIIGRGVRVVERLKELDLDREICSPRLLIEAEHIELKPDNNIIRSVS